MEEAKKMKCYKRLLYKQFVHVPGLCGPQFLSYLPKCIMDLCRALYGDAIFVYCFGQPILPPEINKNIWSSLFLWKVVLFTREVAHGRINIFSNTWNGYTGENQEQRLFFSETAFLFWCHALWKLRISNSLYFRNETCYGNEGGGGTPHMKWVGMLVVLLRRVNFGFWSHLEGWSGQNAIMFSREGLV